MRASPSAGASTLIGTLIVRAAAGGNREVLSVFDADQLEVIAEFVQRERGLLTRHT